MQFSALSQVTSKREVDYGKAIGELIKVGFPDAKGAKYVKSLDNSLEYIDRSSSTLKSGENSPKLSGNGFYIPSSDNTKSGQFITFGGKIIEYSEKNSNPNQYGVQNKISGQIIDADLKKDLEIMQKWALEQSVDSNFSYNGTQLYSAALSFASLAYQVGMKQEANELIKILFLNHENPEQIINQLINGMADEEYNKLHTEFITKPDWEIFHAGLLRIQDKYPRGWENHSGLSILIPLVKKRVDDEPVGIPSIEGHEFSDEIKKLLLLTAQSPKIDNNSYYGNPGLFLVNKADVNIEAPAIHQLTQYGMDGFIALAALIGDDTLVVGNPNHYSSYSRSHHYSSSYGDEEGKSPEAAYESLNKPQTRGDVAESIVRQTLPHNDQELSQLLSDQLRELAIEWWREHRKDDKMTLIKHYFEHGNSSHMSQLAMSLINEDTEVSRKLFEDSIITSANPGEHSEVVKFYVKKRRAKAKGFLESYEKVLLDKLGELTNKNEYIAYNISEAGGTRKYIASLMHFTEELKPDQLFENLAKKGSDARNIMEMLGSVYSEDAELSAAFSKFIHVAAQTDETKKRDVIIEALYNMIYYGGNEQVDGFSAPNEAPKTFSFTDEQKADWLKLLALDEETQSGGNTNVVGMLLDKHLHSERTEEDYQILWRLGNDAVKDIIKDRSMAFLEGKLAEPLPSINLVSQDRKEKILTELGEVSALKFREMYVALSYSERLVVILDSGSQAKFDEAGTFIKGIDVKNSHAEVKIPNENKLKELLKPMLDKKIGAQTYAELAKIITQNMQLFEGVAVSPHAGAELPGRDLYLMTSNMFYLPELDIAMADLVAGKREDFVVMVANTNQRTRSSLGQKPQTFIFDKKSPIDPKKLEEIMDTHSVTITPVTKKVIEDWKKNQVNGKEKVVNELIQFQPSLEDMRARLLEMELDELQDALNQMKENK